MASSGTKWDGLRLAVKLAVERGEKRVCSDYLGVALVAAGEDRGHRFLLQTREGERGEGAGDTGEVGVLSTVVHSGSLSPPSPAPAGCSTIWPQEFYF